MENVEVDGVNLQVFDQLLGGFKAKLNAKESTFISRPRMYWTNFPVANVKEGSRHPMKARGLSLHEYLETKGYALPEENSFMQCFPCLLRRVESVGQDKMVVVDLKRRSKVNAPINLLEDMMGFPVGYTKVDNVKSEFCRRKLLGNSFCSYSVLACLKGLASYAKGDNMLKVLKDPNNTFKKHIKMIDHPVVHLIKYKVSVYWVLRE